MVLLHFLCHHRYQMGIEFNKDRELSTIRTGPEVIKLFSCSTQLSMKFFLLINVKMPTIFGILVWMSGKNSILGLAWKSWISWYFYIYEHLKFHAQLSWAWKKFYNLGPRLLIYNINCQKWKQLNKFWWRSSYWAASFGSTLFALLCLHSQYDMAWLKLFFFNFADIILRHESHNREKSIEN